MKYVVILGDGMATLVPCVTIPVSLVGTFFALKALDMSINLLSLFALVLAVAVVVDDAIVVIENVKRHIDEGKSAIMATQLTMEEVGFDEDVLTANVHTYGSAKLKTENIKKGWRRKIENACADFHVYALEWTPQSLKFFIDGKFLGEYPRPKNPDYWHFDKPMYLLMNLAIGGSWGGKKGIDDAIFPAKYYIDYVRYYK